MPEGDTVHRACARLDRALAGGAISRFDLRVPSLAERDLTGWTVHEVVPRGKHLLMRLRPSTGPGHVRAPLTLHSHLRMEGRWLIDEAAQGAQLPPIGAPFGQVRAVLEVEHADGRCVRAVGAEIQQVRLLPSREEDQLVGHLGPDLLDAAWGPDLAAEAATRLRADLTRPIGLALLDQRCLAGIGNVYRSEICFLRGVHPSVPVGEVESIDAMVDLSHRLLDVNRDRVTRITTGGMMGRRGDLWVYGRSRRPCRRCGAAIRREEISDPSAPEQQERSIYVCPRCQGQAR